MLLEIRRGEAAFDRFIAALKGAELPTDDLFDQHFRYFEHDGRAWGGVGSGEDALLRSVVVADAARGRGLGAAIVNALADKARAANTKHLWLLTTSASRFFEGLGWRSMERAAAPPQIAASRQFAGICPVSATLMVRAL